jgi:hypothetical protein
MWWGHEKISELGWLTENRASPPPWLKGPHTQLDWGAVLVEVSREDIIELLEAPPLAAVSLEPWRRQRAHIEALPAGRYGIIWLEEITVY